MGLFGAKKSQLGATFETAFAGLPDDQGEVGALPDVRPLVKYQNEPLGFLVDALHIPRHTLVWSENPGYNDHMWDGTADPLVVVCNALRDWMDCCVEAGTGTQKSFTAAGLALWFLGSFYESAVYTFAPKEEQLRAFMWMEINRLWPAFKLLFPTAVITDLKIRMRGPRDFAWCADGYSVSRRAGEESAVVAQGMHREHMLFIYEEMPGIDNAVIVAGENSATAPHNLRLGLGNPDHQLDTLHLFGHDQFGVPHPGVIPVRISALDHPNIVTGDHSVVPGAVSLRSIERRGRKYDTESRLYKSRIRGISPEEAQDALIKLEWVRRAQKAWEDERTVAILTQNGRAKKSLGVDVANSEDGDLAAISRWTGNHCREVEAFPCPDANDLGFQVHLEMDRDKIDEENVGVDSVGVGAGTVNELHKRDKYIRALGSKDGNKATPQPYQDETYADLRAQILWTLREDLRNNEITLPPSLSLAQDLIAATWDTRNGKIKVESKETLKGRLPGGRSPNEGDAVAYGNFVRPRISWAERLPKRRMTHAQRLEKELKDLDKLDPRINPKNKNRFGPALRQ